MPTNILRSKSPKPSPRPKQRPELRQIRITAGAITIRAELAPTLTAERIWAALPLYSTAETWGEAIHFELPIKTGRERAAVRNVAIGDICFWSEDDRVIIAFGPTPISKNGEIRLPSPCNVWARAIDDPARLHTVTPGEKVELARDM